MLWEKMNSYKPAGETYPLTAMEITKETGWHLRSVQRNLRELTRHNLISRRPGLGGTFIIVFKTDCQADSQRQPVSRATTNPGEGATANDAVGDTQCRLPQSENGSQTPAITGSNGVANKGGLDLYSDLSFRPTLRPSLEKQPNLTLKELLVAKDDDEGKEVGKDGSMGNESQKNTAHDVYMDLVRKIQADDVAKIKETVNNDN